MAERYCVIRHSDLIRHSGFWFLVSASNFWLLPLPMSSPPWELPDDKLLAESRFEAFVGPGPGGQKRHKTNAAVRYTHVPSGIHAVATDSRSQRENKIHALRALRHKLAMEMRREIGDPVDYR